MVVAGVVMAHSVGGQSFTGPVSYYDVEFGSTLVLDGDHWEFRIIGRKGFLRMLSEIHGNAGYRYEVHWGRDLDRLRIRRRDNETDIDLALRRVLPAFAMTYRIDGGIYNIITRPIPVQDYGLEGPDESHLGKRSLDALAKCLSEQGIGYRVEGARSSVVGLTAPFVSLRTMLWIVQELDPNLAIDTRNGVVVRSRFYYR
ncbi:MAG: hypothetical protein WD716_12995 [Fimbriimonadaceae bacterium]